MEAGIGGAVTQSIVGVDVIAGVCVMAAVVAVIASIATFMGIRAFKKSRKARKMKGSMRNTQQKTVQAETVSSML